MSIEEENNLEEANQEEQATKEEVNPIEAQALEMGWKPKDEFKGDLADWKGAGAFVKDAELFSSLKKQGSQIKDLKKTLEDMKSYMQKSEQSGYERALKELQVQQAEAKENLDFEQYERVSQEAARIQQEIQMAQPQAQEMQKSEAEIAFEERNKSWYNTDTQENRDMMNFAVVVSSQVQTPGMSAEENLKITEERIKAAFPHKFSNKNSKRHEPPAVSTGGARATKKSSINYKDLPRDVQDIAERFVKTGVFKSIDEYIKDAQEKGIL